MQITTIILTTIHITHNKSNQISKWISIQLNAQEIILLRRKFR